MINIVLNEPEIPYNTGNIARTSYLTKTRLHLIRPLGFSLDSKLIKRAGLDYWPKVDLCIHDSFMDFYEENKDKNLYFATSKAKRSYSDVSYKDGDFIIFGSESSGFSDEVRSLAKGKEVTIPMLVDDERSYNLSNSAAIILFEALRQIEFCL